jgi:hypothetical protein
VRWFTAYIELKSSDKPVLKGQILGSLCYIACATKNGTVCANE